MSDENDFLAEGKQRLGDYPLSNHQREFEWETQMMNSPAEMQEGQLDEREGLPNDDVLDEIGRMPLGPNFIALLNGRFCAYCVISIS